MKKTYVLQFDYEEDKPSLLDTFGVTLEQMKAAKQLYKHIAVESGIKTKSASLIAFLDQPDIPGGVLATMLANSFIDSMTWGLGGGIGGLLGPLMTASLMGEGSIDPNDLIGMLGHDCASCAGYDACDLPIKKPRDATPGEENI